MELPNMRWYPDLKRYHLPEGKQRFLIYATVKTILTIMITNYHHQHIIVEAGLNLICFCGLFQVSENSRRRLINSPSFFCRFYKHKMDLYDTYSHDKTIVMTILRRDEPYDLKYMSIVSFLRLGILFLSKKKIKDMPFPMNKLYNEMHVYTGNYYSTKWVQKAPNPQRNIFRTEYYWGADSMKWVKIRTCIKQCGRNPHLNPPLELSPVPYYAGSFIFFNREDYQHTFVNLGLCHERSPRDEMLHQIWFWRGYRHNGEARFGLHFVNGGRHEVDLNEMD